MKLMLEILLLLSFSTSATEILNCRSRIAHIDEHNHYKDKESINLEKKLNIERDQNYTGAEIEFYSKDRRYYFRGAGGHNLRDKKHSESMRITITDLKKNVSIDNFEPNGHDAYLEYEGDKEKGLNIGAEFVNLSCVVKSEFL